MPTKGIFLTARFVNMPRQYVFAPQDSQEGQQAASLFERRASACRTTHALSRGYSLALISPDKTGYSPESLKMRG
jgi:hypothetical protein